MLLLGIVFYIQEYYLTRFKHQKIYTDEPKKLRDQGLGALLRAGLGTLGCQKLVLCWSIKLAIETTIVGDIVIMENKMETTIMGYLGFRF